MDNINEEIKYKFSFGYLALKMLGKTLYSNPFAAMSELIANGFDAGAKTIYVYMDLRDKKNAVVEILDDGSGMTDDDVISKYLKVGKNNRVDSDVIMGRKGIGKLAAFYLSNQYYISTKTSNESNSYAIDFSNCENNVNEEHYMSLYGGDAIVNVSKFNSFKTGTVITMKSVDLSGFGEKRFENFYNELSEYFAFDTNDKSIYIKTIESKADLKKEYKLVKKKIAFKNMEYIFYSGDETKYADIKKLNGKEIKDAEKENDDTIFKINVQATTRLCRTAKVKDKTVSMNPFGWIGIHQTINREKAHRNDKNFLNNKYFKFNKIRIYVRNKLAMENILPDVHNTQYYANYIEGEIHCDELDLNDLPDIASSNRQGFDKNDDRVQALIEYITAIVNDLVNYKGNEKATDKQKRIDKQKNAVNTLSMQVTNQLKTVENGVISESNILEIEKTIVNSFQNVGELAKTKYTLFISHKRSDKLMSDFIYYYLLNVCKFDKKYLFYSSAPEGRDESIEVLNKQIVDSLSNNNTYVCFFVGKGFQKSQYCMFEGGAAWAVKQDIQIGLFYDDYDLVPKYLQPMKNLKTFLNKGVLCRDNYTQTVIFLNYIINYLNNNYIDDSDKALVLNTELPDDVQLSKENKCIEDYFDKTFVDYWKIYISDHYEEYEKIYEDNK